MGSQSAKCGKREILTGDGQVGHPKFRLCFGTIEVWQKRQLLLSPMHPGTEPMPPAPHFLSTNWNVPAALSAGTFWHIDVTPPKLLLCPFDFDEP